MVIQWRHMLVKCLLRIQDIIRTRYGVDDFIVLVFGGDVKGEDIPRIIKAS